MEAVHQAAVVELMVIHHSPLSAIIHHFTCESIYFILFYFRAARSSTGMASMMDEMAKTLARRRAQAEKKPDVNIFLFRFPVKL